MDMGVDGMRLDAVPYLFERDGTSCENLPETHEYLKSLRRRVDEKYPNRLLLAEANQWPEDVVEYFGDGDECHMCFHFPIMPRLFMALKMEDRYSIVDIMQQTPEIPENCQWATFLRNHDELTLEMVTDEERDYMRKVYASEKRARINLGIRRRLAPLLGNDLRQIKLLNALLFSLPGSPIIYYGDEIGMGDNIYLGDRNGVRTPLQWSADRNAGFSKADPQRLFLPVISSSEYHFEVANIETQNRNPNSLLWWMKRLIATQKMNQALNRGKLEFLESKNPKILTFIRQDEEQVVLVVANLASTVQHVELDLSQFRGRVPVELFGSTDFPPVGDFPYFLTLSPYCFYWFSLEDKANLNTGQWLIKDTSTLEVSGEPLQAITEPKMWEVIEQGLRSYLPRMRWFSGKNRRITSLALSDAIYLRDEAKVEHSVMALTKVTYQDGEPETYHVAISYAEGERAESILRDRPDLVIAKNLRTQKAGQESGHESGHGSGHEFGQEHGIYYDAIVNASYTSALLDGFLRRQKITSRNGTLQPDSFRAIPDSYAQEVPPPTLTSLEQSNSSVVFGKKFYMKIYRRLDDGENPEVEIGRALGQLQGQAHLGKAIPTALGALNFYSSQGEMRHSLAVIQDFADSETDGWSLMLNHVNMICERVLTMSISTTHLNLRTNDLWNDDYDPATDPILKVAGLTLDLASLLGKRTGELHLALSNVRNPDFTPEAFTPFYQRSLYQSMKQLSDRAFEKLRQSLGSMTVANQALAERVLKFEKRVLQEFAVIKDKPISMLKIRIHGDFHLGQVLFTGKDFVIVDFEGEPARSIGERRLKRTVLRDLAGMLRSFEYAVQVKLRDTLLSAHDREKITPFLLAWRRRMCNEFLGSYQEVVAGTQLIDENEEDLNRLTTIFMLEKAVYELHYELGSRPDWVSVPMLGILSLLGEGASGDPEMKKDRESRD